MNINESKAYMNYLPLVWAVLLVYFFGIWMLSCFDLIRFPIPTEYRDWGVIDLSKEFYENSSPYSFDNGPPFFFIYGPVFSLLISAFFSISGINFLLLTKVIVFACVIFSAILIAYEVFDLTKRRLLGAVGFCCMLWASYNAGSFFILRPDSLGLLITLLVLVAIRRSNNLGTIFFAAFGITLAFYTKQYFLYIALPIFICLYISVGIRVAIIFAAILMSLLAISVVLVLNFWPTYFYASILAQSNAVGGSWRHSIDQFILFSKIYWPLMTLTPLYIYQLFCKKIALPSKNNLYLYVLLVAALCLVPLGKNVGAVLSYYYQLALPPLVIIGLLCVSCLKNPFIENAFIGAIIFYCIFHGQLDRYEPIYSKEALSNWLYVEQILENQKGPKLISTPILSHIGGDALLLDNGHSECYVELVSNGSNPIAKFFPKRRSYFSTFQHFYDGVTDKISKKEFALIVVTQNYYPMIQQNLLNEYYIKAQEVNLQTGGQKWITEFWSPK